MISVFPLLGKLVRAVIIFITCFYISDKKTGSYYYNPQIRRHWTESLKECMLPIILVSGRVKIKDEISTQLTLLSKLLMTSGWPRPQSAYFRSVLKNTPGCHHKINTGVHVCYWWRKAFICIYVIKVHVA